MRGSINWQVNRIFTKSGIFTPGVSKHKAESKAREAGACTWAEIGEKTNIYSYSTAKVYKDVWHEFGHYVKAELGVRDLENLTGEHVRAFLESKIADGIKYSSFKKDAAALAKFENALNRFAENTGSTQRYDFRSAIENVRRKAAATLDRSREYRAYIDPRGLIENISNDKYRLAASIQYESGASLHEVSKIDSDQLCGRKTDPYTGEAIGLIRLDPADTKGGERGRTISVAQDTYDHLETYIAREKIFRIPDGNSYRNALKQAAKRSSQDYTGSGGLLWNFIQKRTEELQRAGFVYDQSISQTSWEMGYERADTIERYLY